MPVALTHSILYKISRNSIKRAADEGHFLFVAIYNSCEFLPGVCMKVKAKISGATIANKKKENPIREAKVNFSTKEP